MATKQIYRSARGKEVDMMKLVKQNEMAVAVGNAGVNARGDKLGPGGTIIKTREEILSERLAAVNAPVIPEPVVQETPAPVVTRSAKKDISNMDPEGKE
jgi:hypothetical protein